MKGRTIVLDHLNDREAAALIVDGQLDDFLIEGDAPRPGTIYNAITERPVKGQGGMFVKTPDGSGFLRQVKGLAPGQTIKVQVAGYAEPGKAIPLTTKLMFKSRYAIVTPDAPGINVSRQIKDDDARDALLAIAHDVQSDGGFGMILRSSCVAADPQEIAEDLAQMLDLAHAVFDDDRAETAVLAQGDGPHVLAWRDWTDRAEVITLPGGFETHGVLDRLDALCTDHVPLGNAGGMYVEGTRALVAVDVNTGTNTSFAAGVAANIACAKALPRALRLLGLGGQITIDLAPMPKKDRKGFEAALRSAFRSDDIETALVGWTPLGHFELQRKRARVPLKEVLT
ncbi:MAG: ribonuclease E/G [Pseudomonadota bacterium]